MKWIAGSRRGDIYCLLIISIGLPLCFGRHYLSLFITSVEYSFFFKISDARKTSLVFIRCWHFQSLGCAQSWHWSHKNNPLVCDVTAMLRLHHTRHNDGYQSMKLWMTICERNKNKKTRKTVGLLSQKHVCKITARISINIFKKMTMMRIIDTVETQWWHCKMNPQHGDKTFN